jgi:hypothetical protein
MDCDHHTPRHQPRQPRRPDTRTGHRYLVEPKTRQARLHTRPAASLNSPATPSLSAHQTLVWCKRHSPPAAGSSQPDRRVPRTNRPAREVKAAADRPGGRGTLPPDEGPGGIVTVSPSTDASEFPGYLVLTGGLRERADASWPLARLEISSVGIRIGPSTRILDWLVPTYLVSWSELESVRLIPPILWLPGVEVVPREPVEAEKRIGAAKLWPRYGRHPMFWIRRRDVPRLEAALRPRVALQRSSKRRWWY